MESIIELTENNFWRDRKFPTESLNKAADLFQKINGKVIIEIGTGVQGEMSGNSVLVWGQKTSAKEIYCLDLEQRHVDDVKNATVDFAAVKAIKADGLKFVKKYKGKIDLLYLDFWVPDKKGDVQGTARAKHYLKAFKLAEKKMNKKSIVLIDDTDHIDPWKQTFIVPEARKNGFKVLWCGRQTCLFRDL